MSSEHFCDKLCISYTAFREDREKYKLLKKYAFEVPRQLRPEGDEPADLVSSREEKALVRWDGEKTITILPDYTWDGPSGPAADTEEFMRGSLVHDVMYQLLRDGCLFKLTESKSTNRRMHRNRRLAADFLLLEMCDDDGMPLFHQCLVLAALLIFGRWSAKRRGGLKPKKPSNERWSPSDRCSKCKDKQLSFDF